ncbi:MAG: hypothetical protein QOK05_1653 [Chloroflexota bacterium]|jgi:hypothetical protein|nr:hypothetical protein [Chloroflexota bacterium]
MEPGGHGRVKLSRAEQRYNYALAIGAVAIVVVLVVLSPHVVVDGTDVPVLVVALLVGAFLFGLGQMLVGISRRRTYLRSLEAPPPPGDGLV